METTPMIEKLKIKLQNHEAWWIAPNTPSSKNSKEIQLISLKVSVCCGAFTPPMSGSQRTCSCGAKYNVGVCSKCGKLGPRKSATFLQNSSLVKEYITIAKPTYNKYMKEFWNVIATYPKPIYLGMYFIRESNRAWDFGNISQIITDLIKVEKDGQPNWVPDDDTNNIIPVYIGSHVAPTIETKGKTKEEVEKLRERRQTEKTGVVLTVMSPNYPHELINYL